MLAGIDDPRLDSTDSHPSSWSHSLPPPCRLSSLAPCADDHGWSGSMASVHVSITSTVVIRLSAVGFGYVTAVSEPSVSAVVSVTAITKLQLRRDFRLWPKPEKPVSVSL